MNLQKQNYDGKKSYAIIMNLSFFLALGVIVFWGLWGFFSKLAVQKIGLQMAIFSYIMSLVIMIPYLLLTNQLLPFKTDTGGIIYAVLAGTSVGIASVFIYTLLGIRPVGITIAITALYPIVTIILSMIFLKETLTLQQTAGLILAMAALVLLNL